VLQNGPRDHVLNGGPYPVEWQFWVFSVWLGVFAVVYAK